MQGSQASTYHVRRVALDQLEPSIPARYYYDPQHYERELEVFWYGMWVMAGREEEVPAPRDYKVIKIGTQSIVIVRDLDGQLRAFHNTCRHRGSILCTEEQGRLPGRSLVCPYHTWTYSLDGQLVGTPRQMESRGLRPGRLPPLQGGPRDLGRLHLRQPCRRPGRAPRRRPRRRPGAVQELRLRGPPHREADRHGRQGQLEAPLRELLGMLPLPARASGALRDRHAVLGRRRLGPPHGRRPAIRSPRRGPATSPARRRSRWTGRRASRRSRGCRPRSGPTSISRRPCGRTSSSTCTRTTSTRIRCWRRGPRASG